MSISGKNQIDWQAFKVALGDVACLDKASAVKRKSKDFFWYSPILQRELKDCFGDLVALPETQDELRHVLSVAANWQVPVTLRGGGTGNYGQAVPLEGGLIVDMTKLNRVIEVGDGYVRVEAGCLIKTLNDTLKEQGQELPVFPSTQAIATIGGFIGGGSGGIGSVDHGMLREKGNMIELKAMSVEPEPSTHVFQGRDILKIHHAWGTNGVIVEMVMKTIQRQDWMNCIASFASFREASEAGMALCERQDVTRKLVTTVDAGFLPYIAELKGVVPKDRHMMLALIDRSDVDVFNGLIEKAGGQVDLIKSEEDMEAAGLPHVFEFAYNHTTLQVLRTDRTVTYLQARLPRPFNGAVADELKSELGDEVLMHHEFIRQDGEIVITDLPIVRYSDDKRLQEIVDTYLAHGYTYFSPHTCVLEDGSGMHPDMRHLAWKKRLDPDGLLNPGKNKLWGKVRHLEADAIEVLDAHGLRALIGEV